METIERMIKSENFLTLHKKRVSNFALQPSFVVMGNVFKNYSCFCVVKMSAGNTGNSVSTS